ncbi:MAG: hypothetical protein HC860_03045 [Alkalinema sp. RU_4_3]|nr:hypothetical protein [Alkalinema sp. RU_4_3]
MNPNGCRAIAPITASLLIFLLGKKWSRIPRSLLNNGYAEKITLPYGFGQFRNGQEITYDQRRLYYNDLRNGQCEVDQPFHHPERFENRALNSIAQVAFVGQELARTHRALTETEAQLTQTRAQLAQSDQQLNDTDQQLNNLQSDYGALDHQLAIIQAQAEDQAQQIRQLNQQIAEATQNYSHLQVQQGEILGQLQARIQHIEDLKCQVADQTQRIALMERSKFWKIGVLWYTCLHRIKQKIKA